MSSAANYCVFGVVHYVIWKVEGPPMREEGMEIHANAC